MKLSDKLAISTSLVTAIVVSFLFFNIHSQLTTTTKDTATFYYKHELQNIKNEIKLLLSKATGIVNTIGVINGSVAGSVENFELSLKDKLEFYLKNNNEIRELKYISLDGNEITTVSSDKLFISNNTKNYKDELFFKRVLEKDFFIGTVYFSDITSDMIVDVATRVIDVKEDKIVGVLYSKISMSHIQELITDKLINFDSVVLQNLSTKEFIYKSSNANKFKDTVYNIDSDLATVEQDGDSYIMVSNSYINSDCKLKFFIFMKEETLFKHINETIENNIYLLLIVILFSFLLVTTIVTNILKPLRVFVDTVIEKSNKIDDTFSKNITVDSDEIKSMELYFNEYIKLLENERNKIKSFNENLQKKVEEELEKSKQKDSLLFEQSKLASMGEMIANIAHQWRQPLSVISTGATGLKIQKEYDNLTDENFYETCDLINKNAQFLSKTIDDFRNFIRGDRKKEVFDISDTIKEFLSLMSPSEKKYYLQMILNLQDNIKLNSYQNELKQCLINIFNNSKDALIDTKEEDRFIFIETSSKENNAIIKIKDSGGGIPSDVLPRIFEPYFTTKHKSKGTGLGLSMTYKIIVDAMGGTIVANNVTYEYNNKSYTGAQFTITLPLE